MKFIEDMLGVKVEYHKMGDTLLPNYLTSRYMMKKVNIDTINAVFIYFREEKIDVISLCGHFSKIRDLLKCIPVLIINKLTTTYRNNLLKHHIPFIVDNKQIYLPFMGTYLQSKCSSEYEMFKKILPSTQMLLLHFIYEGNREMLASKAAKRLNFTSTSIARAIHQLETLDLISVRKSGIQKIIYSSKTPDELFNVAQQHLLNPIKRKIYVYKNILNNDLIKSGETALSELSMLNYPRIDTYATGNISLWEKQGSKYLEDSDNQVAVELWRYDPRILGKDGRVDALSLVLSMRESYDERIEEAVEEILKGVFEGHG